MMYFVGLLSPAWLGFVFGTATLLGPPVIAFGLLVGLAAVVLHVAGRTAFWGDWSALNTGLALCGASLMLQMKVVPFTHLALIATAGAAAGGVLWALRVNRFRWLAPALVILAFGGLGKAGADLLHHYGFAALLAVGCAFIALWIGESRRNRAA